MTTVGLGALAWAILVMDALSYGAAAVITQGTVAAPDPGRYEIAFGVGLIVNVGTASAAAMLAVRTPARAWPPVVQGLTAAQLAAVVAVCALLLTLDINPVDFVAL